MELKEIVNNIAELIPVVDSTTQKQNHGRRTKRPYLKGVKTLREPQFVEELILQWKLGRVSEKYFLDKFNISIRQRFADVLSNLYLGYATLWYYQQNQTKDKDFV